MIFQSASLLNGLKGRRKKKQFAWAACFISNLYNLLTCPVQGSLVASYLHTAPWNAGKTGWCGRSKKNKGTGPPPQPAYARAETAKPGACQPGSGARKGRHHHRRALWLPRPGGLHALPGDPFASVRLARSADHGGVGRGRKGEKGSPVHLLSDWGRLPAPTGHKGLSHGWAPQAAAGRRPPAGSALLLLPVGRRKGPGDASTWRHLPFPHRSPRRVTPPRQRRLFPARGTAFRPSWASLRQGQPQVSAVLPAVTLSPHTFPFSGTSRLTQAGEHRLPVERVGGHDRIRPGRSEWRLWFLAVDYGSLLWERAEGPWGHLKIAIPHTLGPGLAGAGGSGEDGTRMSLSPESEKRRCEWIKSRRLVNSSLSAAFPCASPGCSLSAAGFSTGRWTRKSCGSELSGEQSKVGAAH